MVKPQENVQDSGSGLEKYFIPFNTLIVGQEERKYVKLTLNLLVADSIF